MITMEIKELTKPKPLLITEDTARGVVNWLAEKMKLDFTKDNLEILKELDYKPEFTEFNVLSSKIARDIKTNTLCWAVYGEQCLYNTKHLLIHKHPRHFFVLDKDNVSYDMYAADPYFPKKN